MILFFENLVLFEVRFFQGVKVRSGQHFCNLL
jgi:hypothetical protein